LKPMTEEVMRELIRRYYAMLRGGEPDPKQVEAIIRFARGLPMVVTSAVQLWVKYGVEDFQAVKPEIVANLVDRLMEGVPKAMVPALEAAAIVRWFDQPILRAVMAQEDVREVYNELRRFPFVRTRAEGLALHDAVREIMDENLRVQDAERHRELHERAAAYFENRIGQLRVIPGLSDEWQRLALEMAYHLLRVDEDGGMNLLHKLFEQGLTYFRYQFCHSLLNEAESLPIKDPKSIHRLKYNRIRLKVAEFSPAFVSDQEFTELVKGSDLDPETKWEVLLNYAWFLGFTTQDYKTQAEHYRKSLEALRAIGQEESAAGCIVLSAIASSLTDEPIKKEEFAKRALEISQRIGEPFYAYSPYVELGHLYLDTGEYAKAEEMWRAAVALAQKFHNDARIADSLNRLASALMAQGKLGEAEEVLNSAMEAAKRLPDTLGAGQDKEMYIKRHFGILYQTKGEYDKAIQYYSESAQIYRQRHSIGGRLRTLGLLANCLYGAGRYDQIGQLRPEVESLMPKMQSNEIVASWLIVQGHMLLDDALEYKVDLSVAIEKYCDTLRVALEGNHIIALDEMLNRIFWKLEKVIAIGKRQEAILVLQGLLRYWKEGRSGIRLLKELESEQRQKFIGPARENWVLTRIESALTQGVPKCKPAPWLAY
jgi:tetratricopeptide (TPR) repeat protein